MTVSSCFSVLSALEDPVEFWNTFNVKLEVAKECTGECPKSRSDFVMENTGRY